MEKIKSNLPLFLLCLLPFGFLSFGIVHEGHHIAMMIAFVAILAAMVRNSWVSIFYWYMCVWMLFICIYRMVFGLDPVLFSRALEQFVYMAAGLAIYLAVSLDKLNDLNTYYKFFCISALIQAAIAIGQKLGFDIVLFILNLFTNAKPALDPHVMTGTLGNNNFLAAYLAICLPFFFRKNWCYGLFLIIPCLIFGKTTSAFVPAVIGAIFYFYPIIRNIESRKIKHYGIILLVLGIISGLYYAFFYRPFLSNPRWEMWAGIINNQIFYNPLTFLLGFGPGAGWGQTFPMHNEWLQCWHMYGIIGLIMMIGYAVSVFIKYKKDDPHFPIRYITKTDRRLLAAFIIIVINMFGNYSLHLAPSAFLICMIAGLIEREKYKEAS